MPSTPRVFVSATSRDLGSYRNAVKDVLLTREWHPVVQDNFAPDYREVRKLLREKIGKCQAVICLIGRRYGEEPKNRRDGEPRRSYTQMEYDIAEELGKPIFRFIATEDCVVDDANGPSEDSERAALQQAYKSRIESSDLLWHPFHSRENLLEQVRDIQLPRQPFRHWRLLIGAIAALVLAVGGYSGYQSATYRDPDPCSEHNMIVLRVPDEKLATFLPEKTYEESADKPQRLSSSDSNTQLKIVNKTGRPIRIWRYFPDPKDGSGSVESNQHRSWRPTWVCGESTDKLDAIGGWSFIYVEDLQWSLSHAQQRESLDAWFMPTRIGWEYIVYGKDSILTIDQGFFDDPSRFVLTHQ